MATRLNPDLIDKLSAYGAEDVTKCYHCGNCTAVCHHVWEPFNFPRRPIRALQMGDEARLRGSLEPWLCYYCGQCSVQCPRKAEPGETMMSLRRWLTAQYDITGIANIFYTSWVAELIAVIGLALLVGSGLVIYGVTRGSIHIYDAPGAFLPAEVIHRFDWTLAGILIFLLIVNASRMWWFTTGRRHRELKIPLLSYPANALLLPWHFFTQRLYAKCDDRRPWVLHLILMLSYVTLFVLIMFFLHRMQAGPQIDWSVHSLGYIATLGLIGTTIYGLVGRSRRTEVHYEHSHESDWIFLFLLLYVGTTGIIQHLLHRIGAPEAANCVYVIHLMGVVPMLLLEVPFSKWSHMVYRPLSIYLGHLHLDALTAHTALPVREEGKPWTH